MQFGRHICSQVCISNVKCKCSQDSGDIVDCIEFISGICTDIVV